MEAIGDGAWKANISGSSGGHGGWGGEAIGYGDLWDLTLAPTPSRLTRLAKIFLVGPCAERLLGKYLGLSSPGEILEGMLFSAGAANLAGNSQTSHLAGIITDVTAFLSNYETEIRATAEALERRKEISFTSPSIKKIIQATRRKRASGFQAPSVFCDRLLRQEIESLTLFQHFNTLLRGV